jgi:di/tricarboxylate transporter
MIAKPTKLAKQGNQDAFASLVSFAAIVVVSVYEIASGTARASLMAPTGVRP